MKIDLTDLLRNIGNKADIAAEETFRFDDIAVTRPVKVNLRLVNTGKTVLAQGTIETEVEEQCARCLTNFKRPYKIKIAEEYAKQPPSLPIKKGRGVELNEHDFVYPLGNDNTLDLGEVIRQNLLLALPIKPLCRKECKGV